MVQTLQVPNTRSMKMIAEQSTGAETALLTDATGHLQVDVISGAVADATGNGLLATIDADTGNMVGLLTTIDADTGNAATLLGTIDADTGAISTATQKLATEVGVGTGLLVRQPTQGSLLVEEQYAFAHLAASGQVKATGGFVHSISINTPATASVVTLYDNPAAAGNVVAIITRNVGALVGECKVLDVLCPNGIYVNATVAVDVTVSYR